MAALTGATIASTYATLIKLNANDDTLVAGGGTAIQLKTGDDDDTPIYLNTDRVGIGDSSPDNQLHVTNANGVAKEVLKLEQLDIDEPFILFTGTTASDQTRSLSTDTGVGAVTGHILVSINGTDRWIPFYAKD